MHDDSISEFDRESSKQPLKLESENLLGEIDRLERQREIQSARLKNAIDLVRRYSPAMDFPNRM